MMSFDGPYIWSSPLFVFGIFYLFFLWLALLCKMKYLSHKTRSIYLFNRNMNVLCFTSCLICAIIDIIHAVLSYSKNNAMLQDEYGTIKGIADALYFIASVTLSIILFGRVYFTFKDTIFSLSNCIIGMILSQILLSIILDSSYVILIVAIHKQTISDKYAAPMFLVLIINDILVSFSLIFLFAYKLFQLIININIVEDGNIINTYNNRHVYTDKYNHKQSISNSISSSSNSNIHNAENDFSYENINGSRSTQRKLSSSQSLLSQITAITLQRSVEFDDHQLNLIVVITRHSILSVFAIVFNQIFYVMSYCSLNKQWENNDWLGISVYASRLIGMCGIITALYLSMKFSKSLYYQICACCHFGCYKCCINCTEYRIRNTMT
eukprot:36971_1